MFLDAWQNYFKRLTKYIHFFMFDETRDMALDTSVNMLYFHHSNWK